MSSLQVLFVLILALKGLVCYKKCWTPPLEFNYVNKDFLMINITLNNIPYQASNYRIYVVTDNCDTLIDKDREQCKRPVKEGVIPKEEIVPIMVRLMNTRSVSVSMMVYNGRNSCPTKKVLSGTRDEAAGSADNVFRENCIGKYYDVCTIRIDFERKCEAQPTARVNCTKDLEYLTCNVSLGDGSQLPDDAEHNWYQMNVKKTFIEKIPKVKKGSTTLQMRLYKFDNNTHIYCTIHSKLWDLTSNSFQIFIPNNDFEPYPSKTVRFYSKSGPITFECDQNYPYTKIGLIDSKGLFNRTFNDRRLSQYLSEGNDYNHMILFCVRYSIAATAHTTTIGRTVSNFTEFELLRQNLVTVKDKEANKSEKDTSSTITAIASVVGVVIMILLIYVITKRFCRKPTESEPTLELETYATPSNLLYAELDIRPGNGQAPPKTDESPYAEIVGVLKPRNKDVVK